MSRFLKVGVLYIILMVFMEFAGLVFGWIPSEIMFKFGQFITILLPVIILGFIAKTNIKERFKLKKFKPRIVIYLFIISMAIIPVTALLSDITKVTLGTNPNGIDAFTESLKIGFFLKMFIIAITPAICEEFMFRGLLLDRKIGMNMHLMAVAGGIMFGLFHVGFDQVLYTSAIGMVYCYIAIITGSIFPTIIMHFINNSLGMVLEKLLQLSGAIPDVGSAPIESAAEVAVSAGPMVTLTGIIAAGIGIAIITLCIKRIMKIYNYDDRKRLEENREDREKLKAERRHKTLAPQIIMVVYVVLVNALLNF